MSSNFNSLYLFNSFFNLKNFNFFKKKIVLFFLSNYFLKKKWKLHNINLNSPFHYKLVKSNLGLNYFSFYFIYFDLNISLFFFGKVNLVNIHKKKYIYI